MHYNCLVVSGRQRKVFMDEQNDMTNEYIKAKKLSIIAVILIVLAFSCLGVLALTQYYDNFQTVFLPVALVGFFGGNILALILIGKAYPALIVSDCMKMEERYEKQEPVQVTLPARDFLARTFLDCGFQYREEGYYRKKKFSLLKDTICYYIRVTEDVEVGNALRREVERLYQTGKKDRNLCMLLFVYMDEVGALEKKDIKELGKRNIVMESVMNPNISLSVLVIAADRRADKGYYMEIGRHGRLTLYWYGCKMLRRLFREEVGVR